MATAEKSIFVQKPFDAVFEAAQQSLGAMGARFEKVDQEHGQLTASTSINIATWGETIDVFIQARDDGCEVYVSSRTFQVVAWGKNNANIERFEQGLLMALNTAPSTPPVRPTADPVSPPAPSPAQPHHRIFISYRRDDSADICGRIYDRLAGHFGEAAIFKDVDSIPLGVDFKAHIAHTLEQCTAVLVVIGKQWLTITDENGRRLDDPHDFVHIEVEIALERPIPVIPLLVQGASMPAADELPPDLENLGLRNGLPIRSDPDFHNDMNRLIKGLEDEL